MMALLIVLGVLFGYIVIGAIVNFVLLYLDILTDDEFGRSIISMLWPFGIIILLIIMCILSCDKKK